MNGPLPPRFSLFTERYRARGGLTFTEAVDACRPWLPYMAPPWPLEGLDALEQMHASMLVGVSYERWERMVADIEAGRGYPPGSWARYFALVSLRSLVATWEAVHECGESVAYLESLAARAGAIVAREAPRRPRGRPPALTSYRDVRLRWMLSRLAGCGLPVTTRDGAGSLCGAISEATGVPLRTVRAVWERHPMRGSWALPDHPRRSREPGTSGDTPPFAPGVACARCGNTGQVPRYRAREGGSVLCTGCLAW